MFPIISLIGIVMSGRIAAVASSYSYECKDDSSIVVKDLPPSSVAFFAYQGTNVCSTNGDYMTLTITGCSKDSEIVLAHGTYADMPSLEVLGGLEIQTISIVCDEISASGVAHSINNTFAPSVSHFQEVTLAPTYEVTSSLNVSTAVVGDPIQWNISYPSAYYLQITNCKAYPGSSSGSISTDLINNWCTVTTQLLTDFTSAGSGTATSVIEAFKYYNNDKVYLYCELLVCPTASGCITSCTGGGKRSLEDAPTGMEEPHRVSVGALVKIIDPYSSGNVNVPGILLLTAAVIANLAY